MAPSSMRAAVFRGPGRIAVEARPRPAPGPDEVRVRIRACGICGSDLHLFHLGLYAPGRTPGHEMAGEVEATGPGVEGIEVGQAVAVEPLLSCGHCAVCADGRDAICPEGEILGIHRDGGFAEWVVVPRRRVFAVPTDLDFGVAALTEPTAVAVHGLRRGAFEPGQRVLVLGAGSLGLLTVLAARALGAGDVWATARHGHQAELAKELGAARVLSEAEATPEALDAFGRQTPVDLVIESVGGRADTLRAAAAAIRPGGTVGVLGLFTGPVELETLPLLAKEATLAWSNCYAHSTEGADFEPAIAILGAERERLGALVTERVVLDDIARAYALAADKKAGAVKVSIAP